MVKLQVNLLRETVTFSKDDHILVLNSGSDAFVQYVLMQQQAHPDSSGRLTLAEDNVTVIQAVLDAAPSPTSRIEAGAFHDYLARMPAETVDVAVMNLLYQPGNTWMLYGLQIALYALRSGGQLYVVGAKDRGILTITKRMQEYFGNAETLEISKGQRVICAQKNSEAGLHRPPNLIPPHLITPHLIGADLSQPTADLSASGTTRDTSTTKAGPQSLPVFASKNDLVGTTSATLDEGTRLLLAALDVQATDIALDIGCGAGFIGLHIARLAPEGQVTMVDASLAAVAAAQEATLASGLSNVRVLPSDGAQAVLTQRFDLVATNPPFHQGGIQTTAIAERFIREAAQVLRPQGRFYLVANRFLKYEPTIRACFKHCEEVGGNTRYKVLRGW